MRDNQIGSGIDDIALVLSRIIDPVDIRSLDLALSGLQLKSAHTIAQILTDNTTLTHLDLSRNALGVDGVKLISSALLENRTIQSLSLSHVQMGEKGAEMIAHCLHNNPHSAINVLDISSNLIGTDGVWYIAQTLKENKNITRIDLSDNNIKALGANHLAVGLVQNMTLLACVLSRYPLPVQRVKGTEGEGAKDTWDKMTRWEEMRKENEEALKGPEPQQGQRVLAKCKGSRDWFPGVVFKCNGEDPKTPAAGKTFWVKFDDGDVDRRVPQAGCKIVREDPKQETDEGGGGSEGAVARTGEAVEGGADADGEGGADMEGVEGDANAVAVDDSDDSDDEYGAAEDHAETERVEFVSTREDKQDVIDLSNCHLNFLDAIVITHLLPHNKYVHLCVHVPFICVCMFHSSLCVCSIHLCVHVTSVCSMSRTSLAAPPVCVAPILPPWCLHLHLLVRCSCAMLRTSRTLTGWSVQWISVKTTSLSTPSSACKKHSPT
jgi:hypothetical protein